MLLAWEISIQIKYPTARAQEQEALQFQLLLLICVLNHLLDGPGPFARQTVD